MKTNEIAVEVGKKLFNVNKLLNKMEMEKIIERPKFGCYRIPVEKEKDKLKLKFKATNVFGDEENGRSGKSAAM